ncbi:TonB-dependent hemoglobin/transferrin/lactoferrin family receptor [Vibrio mediterranei]|uniref:TonB-dependent hemoglobin/transferrin/lactoferrin family receptor n=1 Tax=Vibrio mediterranei TaxID=689 RepID=UPI00148D0E1E|nr:TonB-dependent hemoglobin/transferrin/lactoferrin family receptor [Vibrio mediterranei]NOH30958.1 TonB-dependent hemoglobin/transferrin/lactoferrin family receptor [Vibrio mediterranei]
MSFKLARYAPCVFILPSFITYNAVAQETERSSSTNETMVVVASRNEQRLQDVAGSVSVITSDEMEKQLSNSIEDSLRYIPGVSMNSDPRFGFADFNIRGMEGSRVKVLVDGVEQPTPYSSGLGGGVMSVMSKGQGGLEPDTLTAIEINKGSSSTLYGSGALGGSVLMRTKTADDLLKGESGHASVDAGFMSRDNSYKTTINLAKELASNVQGMLIYTRREGNERQTHSSGLDVTGPSRGQADPMSYLSNNVLGKLAFQPNSDHEFTLIGEWYSMESDGRNYSLDGVVPPYPYEYSNYHFEDNQNRLRLGMEHQWYANNVAFDALKWKLNWQASESKFNTLDHQTNIYFPADNFDRRRERNARDASLQLDVQFDKASTIGETDHNFTYGFTIVDSDFELETNTYQSNGDNQSGVVEMPPHTDVFKAGLFANDQMSLMNDKLLLNAGVRYDMFQYRPEEGAKDIDNKIGEFNNHDSSAFTGQLGALYRLNQSLSTFAKYARGFKAPTPEELYYSFDRAPMAKVEANPDLRPETSDTFEIGLRQNTASYMWEFSSYYNYYNDFIDTKTTDKPGYMGGVTTRENISRAQIYGVELSGMFYLDEFASLPRGSYLRYSAAWSKGNDLEKDVALNSVAPLTGVVGFGFDKADGFYGWATNVTAVAAKQGDDWSDPDNLKAPGYALVDITAYVRPTKNFVVRGGVFNLLDQKYWQYSNLQGKTASSQGVDRYTQPGINFGVNAKYEF